jgi:rod shape-determining protein MreD
MSISRHQGGWIITLTIFIALLLGILPLPDWAENLRPEWAVLVMLYWCIALPQRIGVGIAWIVGLLLDVLTGTLLGQRALSLAVASYIAMRIHQRIRIYPLIQQALIILVLIALYQLLNLWFDGIIGQPAKGWSYWLSSLTSMAMWPWVFLLLRRLRRRFKVR